MTSGTWTVAHPDAATTAGNGFFGVSCPTTTFCAAVDGSGDAVLWNGDRWSSPVQATTLGSLNSVSCTSPTFCVALSGQVAVQFDGTAWTTSNAVGPAPSGPTGGQYQVSCTSPTFCASVNTAGVVSLYDGTTWGHDALVADGTATKPVQNVSCATPTFCVVVSTGRRGRTRRHRASHSSTPCPVRRPRSAWPST
jgi:hypothetical protein